jgi:two-component system osmolarity sensor histidine kinase EnvZ
MGRFMLLIILPLVMILFISGWTFYRAHITDSSGKAALFAANVSALADMYNEKGTEKDFEDFKRLARNNFSMDTIFEPGAKLQKKAVAHRIDLLAVRFVSKSLGKKLARPFTIDADEGGNRMAVHIQYPGGVLSMKMSLSAIFSRTIYSFAYWMLGAAAVFMLIAVPFAKGQVESIKKLARALDMAERGEDISGIKFTGPRQIVEAGENLVRTYTRVQRHVEARSQMLLGISHDLKTPLTRMNLELEFAEDKNLILALQSEIEEMNKMISSYLDFARENAPEKLAKIDLVPFLGNIVRKMNRGNYDITLHAPKSLEARVMPNALERAVANVLGNAIRYSEKKIDVWLAKKGRAVEIAIEDNGPGIPADRREDMLRPFTRLEDSRSRKTGGAGLGLAIVQEIVHRHGGEITLSDSTSLGGLKVVLQIPA